MAHDTSNSIYLQVLVIFWESYKCNGAILSGSITYLLKHDGYMFFFAGVASLHFLFALFEKAQDMQTPTVISFMFRSVFSFLTISGGHGEPAMIPKAHQADKGASNNVQTLLHNNTKVCTTQFGPSNFLPHSSDDKSYLCKPGWLSMSVNIVGVP